MELYHRYGVENIVGIKYGFQGLIPKYGHAFMELTPEVVKDIHTVGGSHPRLFTRKAGYW